MQVIKKGRAQNGWSKECVCTGCGNNGGGCDAVLLVEFNDLFITSRADYDGDYDTYVTFKCPECGVLTDIPDSETPIRSNIPSKWEWEQTQINHDRYDPT
jgi:hypothetical protein